MNNLIWAIFVTICLFSSSVRAGELFLRMSSLLSEETDEAFFVTSLELDKLHILDAHIDLVGKADKIFELLENTIKVEKKLRENASIGKNLYVLKFNKNNKIIVHDDFPDEIISEWIWLYAEFRGMHMACNFFTENIVKHYCKEAVVRESFLIK